MTANIFETLFESSTPKTGIYGFEKDNHFLSNFYLREIEYEKIIYPSTEHAYQAAKTLDLAERKIISGLKTPGMAKRYGKKVILRNNWDSIKDSVMQELVFQKFTRYQDLKMKLLNTGSQYLEETNTWGDTYWGVCRGTGQNRLGYILMNVRSQLS